MRRNVFLYLALLLLQFVAPAEAAAKDNYNFTHIKSDAGLPHQQVNTMAFDHDGMLWVGTRNGLARYDGYSFRTYYHIPKDSTSIQHNFIKCIFVDSNNDVWVGSEIDICRYRRDTDDFERYDLGGQHINRIVETADGSILCSGTQLYRKAKDVASFTHIRRQVEGYIAGMAEAPDKRIFISTNQAISYFRPDMKSETAIDASIYRDFISGFDVIAPLFFDRDGKLWIGRDGKGVMCLDIKSGEKHIYGAERLSDGTVRTITQDSDGRIWLGTEKGINIIDPATDGITQITQEFGNSRSLSDNAVYCIVADADNNIWIGTYFGGINLVLRNAMQFGWTAPGYNLATLSGKAVRRIIEPTPGTLWIATEDGGINILDIKSGQNRPFTDIPNLGTNVHELYYDADSGDMWIGTFRNGLFRYNLRSRQTKHYTAFNSGLKSNAIFAIARQKNADRRLWIATTIGLMQYDPATDSLLPANHPVLDVDFIYSLHPDNRGNMWVGTVNRGLCRIDGHSNEIRGWEKSASAPDMLKDNYITAICEDYSGRIFVGTNNGGMHLVDGRTMEFKAFNDNPNIFGTVCNIFRDPSHNLWVSSSAGLFRINPDNFEFQRFTTADGLPENQFNFASGMAASDGRMYCGTVNGLVSFDPAVKKSRRSAMPVHLWSLTLNNHIMTPRSDGSPLNATLDATEALELDYSSSRVFSIDYGVVDPTGAGSVRYQIFVEGLDKDWRDVGNQRRFTAMEIPYGSYTFKVRALASGDDWSEAPVRQLQMHINPPYYLSSMAWLIYFILGIGAIYAVYRFFTWRMHERQLKRLAQIEREQKDELNREKMEFFTNISHELKTPLSLILAPLKHLSSEQNMTDESRQRLSTAIANTSKMVDLINELVTFNRVESGNFQFFLQKSNPLTLIETLAGYFSGPAAEKSISINVMTRNNGEDVWFSTTYLERIVSNLLSNAIKYTGEGGNIDVRASIEEGDDGYVYLLLDVKDNGIGIAPEEIDNIFRKYYQTKRGYNAAHSGWGIGLATVQKLVDIHKGSVSVASKIGEGSCFTVRLNVDPAAFDPACRITPGNGQQQIMQPAIISNSLAVYNQTETAPTTDDKRVSILLVEDNPQLLRFLSDEFAKEYNVFTATNGVEALKVTGEYPIDIVVSDVMMPEMDGIELCDRLKTDLATSHIPVILLTAKTDEQSTMAGFKSGAEAYVSKPFDPELLALRVKNILRARRAYINSRLEGNIPESETDAEAEAEAEQLPPLNKFDNEFIAHINRLVNSNLDNSEFSVADITRELGISRSLLHIKMKTFFNASMTDYIKQCRMNRACELLRQGYNVSETAYETGFSDPNYFSKVFKKVYGIPPKEFSSSSPKNPQDD